MSETASAPPAPAKPAAKPAAPADERPYGEAFWKRAQEAHFRLLDIRAGRLRADPQAVTQARQLCQEAEEILRSKTESYEGFLERLRYSEKFLSDSARIKKSELYLKQLYLKKTAIEELVRALS
jgi:hypothetical protein